MTEHRALQRTTSAVAFAPTDIAVQRTGALADVWIQLFEQEPQIRLPPEMQLSDTGLRGRTLGGQAGAGNAYSAVVSEKTFMPRKMRRNAVT